MIIRIPLRFEGSKGDKILYALFDSGATYSCISEYAASELSNLERLHTPMRLATASDTTFMEIKTTARLDFYHHDTRMSDEFLVVPGLSEEAIIGATTMQKWKLKLDFENDSIVLDPRIAKAVPILINLIRKD